jgi:hypothetical protein
MAPHLARPSSFRTFRGGAAWPPPSRCRLERSAIGSPPGPPAAPPSRSHEVVLGGGLNPLQLRLIAWREPENSVFARRRGADGNPLPALAFTGAT